MPQDQPVGGYGSSAFNVQLAGIEVVDTQVTSLGTAVFGADGSATLNVAPEPATLTLFGSGFAMLAGISAARRRRA